MTVYQAPIDEMRFAIDEIAEIATVNALSEDVAITPDMVAAILEEAGKFCSEVLAPINQRGDSCGSFIDNGVVRTPEGFSDAYKKFVKNGWLF